MNSFISVALALVAFFGTVRGQSMDGRVRLNNRGFTNTNAGVVEIYYNGEWGLVCNDDYWNFDAATVACRQAGFAAAVSDAPFGKYYDPTLDPPQKVWLKDVYCYSDKINTLGACVERPPTRPVVCPGNVASVLCADVRLVETSNSGYSGQVEVYNKGQWYGICGERWGQEEADVVCNMLFPWESNYPSAQSVQSASTTSAVPVVNCFSFDLRPIDETLHDCRQISFGYLTPSCNIRAAVSCVQGKKKEVDVSDDLKLRATQLLLELLQETKK